MTREDDGPTLRVELRPHAQAHLVSLPAKQLRVYRPHEGVHAIEAFWCRAGRQPFEIAVRTRDVSVRAGCDVDDDFSTLRHEYRSPLARGAGSELIDRKSTRLNSSHVEISYAVFCLKKKKNIIYNI